MEKTKLIVISISIILTLIISAVASLPTLLFGLSISRYLTTFCILIALQLFIGGMINYYISKKEILDLKKIDAINNLTHSVQYVDINCSYCGSLNNVRLLLNEKNIYDCTACNQSNSILVSISSSRVTNTPLPKEDVIKIFKSIDQETNKKD